MKNLGLILYSALFSSILNAQTPQLAGPITFQKKQAAANCSANGNVPCVIAPWESMCNEDNVIFSPNSDGSFDIIFLNFSAETEPNYNRAIAQCHLEIPIQVPEGMKVRLDRIEVAGITDVSRWGKSEASISYKFANGKQDKRTEQFKHKGKVQDLVLRHQLKEDYTSCWKDQQAVVSTTIELLAERGRSDWQETFIAIDEGAISGRKNFRYRLEYQKCDKPSKVKQCSDYKRSFECRNNRDGLNCSWDVYQQSCRPSW